MCKTISTRRSWRAGNGRSLIRSGQTLIPIADGGVARRIGIIVPAFGFDPFERVVDFLVEELRR